MWSTLQISCYRSRDFSASGLKFSDSIFSLWAACLLFAISTPVMFGTVHCPSYSRLGETESCVASEPSDDREEQTASPPSPRPPQSVFPSLSLFLSFSLRWNTTWGSVCERVSVCVLYVCLGNCAYLWLPVYLHGCAEKLPSRQKKGETSKAASRKSQQLWKSLYEENSSSAAAAVNIVDFKGNKAGAQRGSTSIGYSLRFSICIKKTCAGRYTYVHTPAHVHIQANTQWCAEHADCCHFSEAD